jgi:putative membrane protein (TIGR04086 family)
VAVRFDGDALRKGIAVALGLSVPVAVLWRVLVSGDDRPWWTVLFSLVVLVALGGGAFVAARTQHQGTPLAHGLVVALGAFVVVTVISIVGRAVRGDSLALDTVVSNLLLALVVGSIGGLLGGRARAPKEQP